MLERQHRIQRPTGTGAAVELGVGSNGGVGVGAEPPQDEAIDVAALIAESTRIAKLQEDARR